MAMLIGAARLLATRRAELCGTLVLCFQPAEERHPLSNPKGGAIRVIRDLQAGEQLATRLRAPASEISAARERQAAHTEGERLAADGEDARMDSSLLSAVDEVYGAPRALSSPRENRAAHPLDQSTGHFTSLQVTSPVYGSLHQSTRVRVT